jgi:L-alanine-DL-glutamate epimerase-like enolase superfamily enzyme
MEEVTHPEKIGSFAEIHRSTTIPVASGEHFYGRWEVERYLQANALSIVQADPEWCGGTSELLKIGVVASLHDFQYHCEPVAHDISAGRISHSEDAALLSLREQSDGSGESAHCVAHRTGIWNCVGPGEDRVADSAGLGLRSQQDPRLGQARCNLIERPNDVRVG